jgi:protein O-GlcNAc transferase
VRGLGRHAVRRLEAAALALALACAAGPAAAAALKKGDYGAAVVAFKAVLEREPRNPEAMRQLGAAYLGEGRLPQAFAALQILRVLHPDDPRVHYDLARVYYEAGLPDRERTALGEALRLRPTFAEAHQELARSLATSGELYAAAAEYTWLVDRADASGLTPDPAILYDLAVLKDRLGESGEAVGLLRRCLTVAPNGVVAKRARTLLARLAPAP